jgi:alkylation response protein AidB-like acyl-CoA dehydrogenase
VDPELSADQKLLRDTTEDFITATLPLEAVRARMESGSAAGPEYRAQAAELGWFAFLGPEELGGGGVSGAGLLDAAVLAELRGRHLQPGGFVDTNVVVSALTAGGTEEQQAKVLPELVAGESAAAWVLADPAGDVSGAAGLEVTPAGSGYRVSGLRGLVVDGQAADWLLVTAPSDGGLTQFLLPADTPGVTIEPLTGLDLTRSWSQVRFDGAEVPASTVVGAPGRAADAVAAQLGVAGVLAIAETVGAMQYLFDLSLQYARDRTAFGRPIGSFQALKHQLADTSLVLEQSLAVAAGAAREVQAGPSTSASMAASMAKAYVGDAAVEVGHKSWQIFGGISYTWEHDFHLYLRRLTADAALYGSPAWHRERVAQLAGL